MLLYLDTETYSATPITNGTYEYTRNCEVILCTYAFGDEPVQVWDFSQMEPVPQRLLDALHSESTTLVMHNSMFDRNVISTWLGIDVPTRRIHDTMVMALLHALPASLDMLGKVLNIGQEEQKLSGKNLINVFCKPLPKNRKRTRTLPHHAPEDWQLFRDYAIRDVEAMRAIYKKIPRFNFTPQEHELWQLDQHINDRGFAVDLDLARCAVTAIAREQHNLANKTKADTGGQLDTSMQRDALLAYMRQAFPEIDIPDITKNTMQMLLDSPDTPLGLKALVSTRLRTAKSSTSKYARLFKCTSPDQRLRGTLQFSGAARTRRWAGRTFQPQNLPRPPHYHSASMIEDAITLLKHGELELLEDNIMDITSSMLRGCIVAGQGKKLVAADLSNIEGRINAWVSGEEWKLKAFDDYDNRGGHDLYKLAYARAFNAEPETVSKDQRQIGKVQELALGFQGGVSAFVSMASVYNMDLARLAEEVLDTAPPRVKAAAMKWYDQSVENKNTFGLARNEFVACDIVKRLWREAHPNTCALWDSLNEAAKLAIVNEKKSFSAGEHLCFYKSGNWLRLILPSGRSLCYPSPKISDGNITYLGVAPLSKKWSRLKIYGGKFLENVCQSLARDVMAENMPAVEEAGYEIILTVHDELITEASDVPFYTAQHLSQILAEVPAWADGLPLSAAGFESYRYRKD